jgi:SNF2 family DNA or RNA helicase
VLLDQIVRQTPLPATFGKKVAGTLLATCLGPAQEPWRAPASGLPGYRQWQEWHRRVVGSAQEAAFSLGFRLLDPPADADDQWALQFVAIPRDDPSQRLALADYWSLSGEEQRPLRRQLGDDFETELLLNLGLAARMVPKLWDGLDTAQPQAVTLDLDEAFAFLKEWAWVLEDAGFKIIVPAWWTPQGRRRVRLRLRSSSSKKAHGAAPTAGGLSLERLVQYRYELAIGDQLVSPEEWQQLVEAKTPLVRFRGQWVELDPGRMQEMLAFWRQHGKEAPEMSVQDLLQRTATDDTLEVEPGDALAEMLERLRDRSRLEPIADLPGLKAELRDYQKRGVAWLRFLEGLGLNGCLADDMGLGKTMQVIARLVQERASGDVPGPTLLVAPTSVIGNWQKEVLRFAPQLSTLVHHGPAREQDAPAFQQTAAGEALVITSYPLVRRDQALFTALDWHRVVLDEAQNIKNPQAAQTKAVTRLRARHRLALTGTPVENRLMDLWSIFHFTNPGYLDTQARFRNRFELPVQRDNNPVQTAALKRLVEPFILRRVKTDKAIIRDLPDKVEAIQYCNLSREQAALYEGVVREVERELEEKEGIARQGLMLSTLMRLKQICNHPAQFLQDGSTFTPERSHKLERLEAMLDEVMAEGDSVLIFSQFTEIGGALERRLRQELRHNTFFLHGGTPRSRREAMIAAFQDPQGEPAVFVLSLKAGGVGITLTKANHVFHFDRWWNPAVEDQASDRAFRIGQEKTVFVHKLVTLGTLEERINDMIEEKKALAGAIVGTDESWLTQLDNERFKALIRLNREAVVD